MFNIKKKSFKQFDFILFAIVLILCGFGLLMIKSATLSMGTSRLVKTQAIAMILGFIGMVILALMDYQFLGKLYIPIYVVCILLLLATIKWGFGMEQWGADSWLSIGGVAFQPSEFVKVGLIISLAKFIDNNKAKINEPVTLLKILAFAFLPVYLILKQPDAGTAMVFVFFIAIMLFVAGIDWKYVGYAFIAGLASLPLLWLKLGTYQMNRIFDFLHPERDPTGTGYQALQGKIAIGSGKIFGRGLFNGVFTQYDYIPIKESDFIYSVIVEELGFIGGIVLIILFFVFLIRLIRISKNCEDLFGATMVMGFAAMFVFHIWENIGMTMGLMPVTGIPLPFISHGGTFILVSMASVGIALSVGMHREGLNF
ncbi:MAG TPA: rod shape-determining protein RodA [Tissierellaceae bacterium]|nr:rod shape-determining protein RodA [Tissierellaceae bacterium]